MTWQFMGARERGSIDELLLDLPDLEQRRAALISELLEVQVMIETIDLARSESESGILSADDDDELYPTLSSLSAVLNALGVPAREEND